MNIKLGHYNWSELGSNSTYYPEDMPKEWQLSYYANEFECVELALETDTSLDDIEEWIEGLSESFCMVIKQGSEEQIELLKNECHCVISPNEIDHCFYFEQSNELKQWKTLIEQKLEPLKTDIDNETNIYLFLNASNIKVDEASQVRQMIEFMGY